MKNFQHHLLEIKFRFFYLIFSTLCTFLVCFNSQLEFVYIIGKPFLELQQTFIFLELTEAFYTLLKLSTIMTLFVLVPFFLYQIWSYFIPSFYLIERNKINFFFFFFFFLFFIEIFFAYFFLLPKICNFLISFEITSEIENSSFHKQPLISVEFTARIESYVSLILKMFCLLLTIFQLPLFVCLLYSKKILHVSSLYSNRKILSLISLLMSAFLVPPDLISQLVVSIFFLIVFEILIFIGLFFD